MEKQWFVLHTLSGKEGKVRENIARRAKLEEIEEYVGEILIPTEKVSEVKHGKKTTTTRKFYPGYVLLNIHLYDENRQLVEKSWYFIQDTPGVIGFVGGDRPVPLREEEVNNIMAQIEEKKEKVKLKVNFEVGETVKINDGPFLSFSGVIEEIDPERGKLRVSVSIFGRSAPVELEYWQVEKDDAKK
ncbi:MAG: transcription termination/antitermination factor NusG [Kiritimatiellae bacterium]|nr:transcription termination/antitermination factor NusG [Kiritimatiellia bacterium]MCO5060952.1 transcription termination/antitermination protein NusG [Kiritimatiellia bacterium]MCO5068133.1 transcription termination/antitermination protein NusG [Kiritimatiellia bacterium]